MYVVLKSSCDGGIRQENCIPDSNISPTEHFSPQWD